MATIKQHQVANAIYLDEGIKILELAERVYSLWVTRDSFERHRILDTLLSNCIFDCVTLYPTYRKPFCWLAKGPDRLDWLGIEDGLRNFLRSEECLETSQLVASFLSSALPY